MPFNRLPKEIEDMIMKSYAALGIEPMYHVKTGQLLAPSNVVAHAFGLDEAYIIETMKAGGGEQVSPADMRGRPN